MIEQSYEKLRNEIITCTKCELSKSRMNAAPGIGSLVARAIFIGEGQS